MFGKWDSPQDVLSSHSTLERQSLFESHRQRRWLPVGVMQGTAEFHHESRAPSFHSRIRSLRTRQRLTLLVDMLDPQPTVVQGLVGRCGSRVSSWPGCLGRMRISTWGSVNARKPRPCNNRLRGQGIGRGLGDALVMDAAAVSVAEEEDDEQRIH